MDVKKTLGDLTVFGSALGALAKECMDDGALYSDAVALVADIGVAVATANLTGIIKLGTDIAAMMAAIRADPNLVLDGEAVLTAGEAVLADGGVVLADPGVTV